MIKFIVIIFFLFNQNVLSSKELCEYKTSTSSSEVKYVSQKSINVDDIKGHIIRIFKTETNHKNPKKNCEGLSLVRTDFFGISDYINKNGRVTGYSIGTYDDGSKIFSDFIGTAQTPEDQSMNGFVFSTITITGGTKTYKGISGFGKGKVEFNPETGYSSGYNKLFYTINK